jgi:hypothetical protein
MCPSNTFSMVLEKLIFAETIAFEREIDMIQVEAPSSTII